MSERQQQDAVARETDTRPGKADYLLGFIDGLTAFAWWKDGEQFVGTFGTTLADAIKDARREHEKGVVFRHGQ